MKSMGKGRKGSGFHYSPKTTCPGPPAQILNIYISLHSRSVPFPGKANDKGGELTKCRSTGVPNTPLENKIRETSESVVKPASRTGARSSPIA
jgi:hypothetical protein